MTNITLQDGCEYDVSGDLALNYDPVALHLVLSVSALDPANATPPPWVFVPPFLG